MVDYVDNVESEIAVGKPIKASTGLKMVRNFLSIITGGTNAPKIENDAFADNSISGSKLITGSVAIDKLGAVNAGDIEISERYTSATISNLTYLPALVLRCPVAGTIRFKWTMVFSTNTSEAWVQIYRNETAVGSEQFFNTSSTMDISQDIAGWSNGDLITLKIKTKYRNEIDYACYVDDFYCCADKALSIVSIPQSNDYVPPI